MCVCVSVAVGIDPGLQMALVCVCTERLQASRLPSDHDEPCAHTFALAHTRDHVQLLFQGSGLQTLPNLPKYLCAVLMLKTTPAVIFWII